MYVCGVTVYDSAHLGHCRFLITFDVIYRYLRFLGFDVTYVRNFTDVDDKIIKRANDERVSWETITRIATSTSLIKTAQRLDCWRLASSRARPSILPR